VAARTTESPDPLAAEQRYRELAARYDRTWATRISRPAQLRAVSRLELQRGAKVVDVACGTGLNFEPLEAAIGPQGRLIGVDVSTEMLAVAATRVRCHGWHNVQLIQSAVEDADLPGPIDAALFSFGHDVLRSQRALEHVFASLRAGGRVAVAGMTCPSRWPSPLNAVVKAASRPYVTTFEGFHEPWSLLRELVRDLRVERLRLGTLYVASGDKAD
jgi:ubiquinone/menaquinone biosynthesis C-methylase UbiE